MHIGLGFLGMQTRIFVDCKQSIWSMGPGSQLGQLILGLFSPNFHFLYFSIASRIWCIGVYSNLYFFRCKYIDKLVSFSFYPFRALGYFIILISCKGVVYFKKKIAQIQLWLLGGLEIGL